MNTDSVQDMRYAGFTDRAAAFIMDGIIVGTLFCYLLEGVVYAGKLIGPLLFASTAVAFDEPEMPVIFGSIVVGTVLLVLLCWLYSAGLPARNTAGPSGR
jgi:hypothetical protein